MYSVGRRFAPQVESASAARRFVTSAVSGTCVDPDDAVLLTSELVNNAILHAHSDFEVRIDIEDHDHVFVAVVNHSPNMLPISREPSSMGGRGLTIIDRIADSWGFESRAESKLVWFRLAGVVRASVGCY